MSQKLWVFVPGKANLSRHHRHFTAPVLKFVNKELYWSLLDRGLEKKLKKPGWPWHLKSIQDLVAFSFLEAEIDRKIAEIGGGNSRILPALAHANECTNIEKFEGADGGPAKETKFRKVRNVKCFVGEFSDQLAESSFDILFSVSVVEHVTNPDMEAFIKDCHRILRPGGSMVHLVDMYLAPGRVDYNRSRVELYRSAFDSQLFQPTGELISGDDASLTFDVSYCTNPDNIMYEWNKVNPVLRPLRETSQSVTLIWAGTAEA